MRDEGLKPARIALIKLLENLQFSNEPIYTEKMENSGHLYIFYINMLFISNSLIFKIKIGTKDTEICKKILCFIRDMNLYP